MRVLNSSGMQVRGLEPSLIPEDGTRFYHHSVSAELDRQRQEMVSALLRHLENGLDLPQLNPRERRLLSAQGLAQALRETIPRDEIRFRLTLLGLGERWLDGELHAVSPAGVLMVETGELGCFIAGSMVARNLLVVFPELAVTLIKNICIDAPAIVQIPTQSYVQGPGSSPVVFHTSMVPMMAHVTTAGTASYTWEFGGKEGNTSIVYTYADNYGSVTGTGGGGTDPTSGGLETTWPQSVIQTAIENGQDLTGTMTAELTPTPMGTLQDSEFLAVQIYFCYVTC